MSKSLKRVRAVLENSGVSYRIQEMPSETKTAIAAANAAEVEVDQIAKSIIFQTEASNQVCLFVTAGGQQVDLSKASALMEQKLLRADPSIVRKVTGFAIGGVSPLGHLTPIPTFLDRTLFGYNKIWAAAGTPRHIFSIDPTSLASILKVQPADFIQ